MSNKLTSNPIYLDTFNADVTISSGQVSISAVYFESNLNTDTLVLEDNDGNFVYRQAITAETINNGVAYAGAVGKWVVLSKPIRANGLVLDISDGNYDGTCFALIQV